MSVRFVLILVVYAPLFAQAPPKPTPAVQRWLHGLEARKDVFARLEAKVKKMSVGPSGNAAVSPSLFCPVALESALAVALTDGHFKGADDNEDFHLIFHGQGKDYLDLSYSYNKRGALLMAAIHKLPAEWAVGFQPGEVNINKLIITTDDKTGCIFEFDSTDPFASKAVASQSE
jgi:hypothetical protein